MAIETLTDWNATLSCCCPMPSCPVPVKVCRRLSVQGYARAFAISGTPIRYYIDKVREREGFGDTVVNGDQYFVTSSISYTGASYVGDEYGGYGTDTLITSAAPRIGTYICGVYKDWPAVVYSQEGYGTYRRVSHTGLRTYLEGTGPPIHYTDQVVLASVEDWTCEYVGPANDANAYKITKVTTSYNHVKLNAYDWQVDLVGTTTTTITFQSTPFVYVYPTYTDETTYEDEIEEPEVVAKILADAELVDMDACAVVGVSCTSSMGSIGSPYVTINGYLASFRWDITANLGSWFKITWDVLFTPVSGSPSFTSVDETWEWTGAVGGPPPGSEDDWKSPWFPIPLVADEGTSQVVNVRYSCYRTPWGDPVELTGTGIEYPTKSLSFSDPSHSMYHPLL